MGRYMAVYKVHNNLWVGGAFYVCYRHLQGIVLNCHNWKVQMFSATYNYIRDCKQYVLKIQLNHKVLNVK